MSASLSVDEIVQIVDVVNSTSKNATLELDALSRKAARVVDTATLNFDTGYDLATWYRKQLGVTSSGRIDPERCLSSLGVVVRDVSLSRVVDAVAVWGPRHGPSVIVNSKGRHSEHSHGRRVTLAHELGHMLLDRSDSLPLAEVLGGRANASVEARARAFAAELLLPREIARLAYAASPESPEEVVASLVDDYGVSREVAAWQIRNSGIKLTTRAWSVLRSYVKSRPGSF
ncbi:MAG: ImmA/IrrE family metallo-endopeptidase [Pseudonocardiaceae bacterium]